MALDNYLPLEAVPVAQWKEGEAPGASDWSLARRDSYTWWRSPGASPSVTLWDEVAPDAAPEMRDAADDSSEA